MKLLFIIIMFGSQTCYAQTSGEWFRQKKVQKKYLLEQIAALKMYGSYLAKGYAITQGGLKAVGGLKQSCFDQDKEFFESLKMVSPRVKQYKRIGDIIAINQRILAAAGRSTRSSTASDQLTQKEINYLKTVFNRVRDECETEIDQLVNVTTESKLEMSDDERIAEIDKLYVSALNKQSFIQSFTNSTSVLIVQREKERSEVKRMKLLNGLQ